MANVVDVTFIAYHGNQQKEGNAKLDLSTGKVFDIHVKDQGLPDYEEIVLKDGTRFEVDQNGPTTRLVVDDLALSDWLENQ